MKNASRHRNHQIQNSNMQSTNIQNVNVQPHARNANLSRTMIQQNTNQMIGNQQILDHHDENLSEKEIYPGKLCIKSYQYAYQRVCFLTCKFSVLLTFLAQT